MKKRNNPKIDAMKQRSLIVESERQNLHTPKFYLTEQEEEIKRKGSYEYKKDEYGYYYRRIGRGQSWKKSSGNVLDLIKTKVFGDDGEKPVTKSSGEDTPYSNAFTRWQDTLNLRDSKEPNEMSQEE